MPIWSWNAPPLRMRTDPPMRDDSYAVLPDANILYSRTFRDWNCTSLISGEEHSSGMDHGGHSHGRRMLLTPVSRQLSDAAAAVARIRFRMRMPSITGPTPPGAGE